MKTISIPTNDRPEYLQRVIDSILAADGHEDWTLCFSMEPNYQTREIIGRLRVPMRCSFNSTQKGCDANTFLAADFAFSLGAEFNLYLEEDTVISKDALTLADEFRAREDNEPSVLCLRRWHASQDVVRPLDVEPANHGLLGNGFAYSMKWYRKHIRSWWFYHTPELGGFGWDWSLSWGLEKQGIRQYRPLVNRSQNIGVSGTTTSSGHDLNHFGECYHGPGGRFRFV